MSDILIKGMEMPVTCSYCPLIAYDPDIEWNDGGRETQGAYVCVMTHELIDNTKREEHCPLVEIPTHGRLIDAEKIYDAVEQRYRISSGIEHRCERDLLDLICAAPTIIEAEEGET